MNLPLLQDFCRCYGYDCKRREECARHKTMEVDNSAGIFSYSNDLCGHNYPFGNGRDSFIEITK